MKLSCILGIVFITLKLTKVISWSWWLVLMPFYLGWALFGLAIIGVFFMGFSGKLPRKHNIWKK